VARIDDLRPKNYTNPYLQQNREDKERLLPFLEGKAFPAWPEATITGLLRDDMRSAYVTNKGEKYLQVLTHRLATKGRKALTQDEVDDMATISVFLNAMTTLPPSGDIQRVKTDTRLINSVRRLRKGGYIVG
jgi:hypothetical protein